MPRVLFTEAAQADLADAVIWYETHALEVMPRFRQALGEIVRRIEGNPRQFAPAPYNTRRAITGNRSTESLDAFAPPCSEEFRFSQQATEPCSIKDIRVEEGGERRYHGRSLQIETYGFLRQRCSGGLSFDLRSLLLVEQIRKPHSAVTSHLVRFQSTAVDQSRDIRT